MSDIVRVNDLLLTVSLATGAHWTQTTGAAVQQPVIVSLSVPHDVRRTASTDHLVHSVNYSVLSDHLRDSLELKNTFLSLEEFAIHMFDTLLGAESLRIPELRIKITQLTPPLHAKSVGLEAVGTVPRRGDWSVSHMKHFVEDLDCDAIIGVNPLEREEKQVVKVNFCLDGCFEHLSKNVWIDLRGLTRTLHRTINASSFLTLEALADGAASEVLRYIYAQYPDCKSAAVTLSAAKPAALVFARSAEVEVRRTFEDERLTILDTLSDFGDMRITSSTLCGAKCTVAIALGSNLGDRFCNIELALRLLEAPKELLSSADIKESDQDVFATIVDTSFLYETAPMYVADQPSFINCACLIETNLLPLPLLGLLKNIESAVGRVSSIRNGPRAVDLDIVLYGDVVIDTRPPSQRTDLDNLMGELVVPHPKMVEREFVLRPLNDIVPDFIHPIYNRALRTLLADLPEKDASMRKVIPFPRYPLPSNYPWPYPWISPVPSTLTHWIYPITPKPVRQSGNKRKTLLMATLNMTPDSFSDGSVNNTLQTGLAYVQNAVKAGTSIIDIGGYSTRPGAEFVSVDEETERVVTMIAAIRRVGLPGVNDGMQNDNEGVSGMDTKSQLRELPLSVDTFRWEVAQASIIAGANCINDVYAFTGRDTYPYVDEEAKMRAEACMNGMKNVAREFEVPVILMHSRGDAGQNKDYGRYTYAEWGEGGGAVLEGVRVELGDKVEKIVKGKGGVRRWMVIVDPGIGFSKTVEGNLEVLRDAADVVAHVEGKKKNPLAGFPFLIGASRKSFLGSILSEGHTGRKTVPKDRVWATTTTVACAVQQGAMVVRVHDIDEMADVARIADALWG